jgi:hypothetical protein
MTTFKPLTATLLWLCVFPSRSNAGLFTRTLAPAVACELMRPAAFGCGFAFSTDAMLLS